MANPLVLVRTITRFYRSRRYWRKFHAFDAWLICNDNDGYICVTRCSHCANNESQLPVDKPKRPKMNHNLAIQRHEPVIAAKPASSIDSRIRAFINGESHGEDVLRALYGDVADEAVPDRLRALLRD
jgi:hypothetical protein